MSHAGGDEEAEAAYDEAVHAIFELQLERHRHIQPYVSKKDGRNKWAMIEMSPMTVSCSSAIKHLPCRVCSKRIQTAQSLWQFVQDWFGDAFSNSLNSCPWESETVAGKDKLAMLWGVPHCCKLIPSIQALCLKAVVQDWVCYVRKTAQLLFQSYSPALWAFTFEYLMCQVCALLQLNICCPDSIVTWALCRVLAHAINPYSMTTMSWCRILWTSCQQCWCRGTTSLSRSSMSCSCHYSRRRCKGGF